MTNHPIEPHPLNDALTPEQCGYLADDLEAAARREWVRAAVDPRPGARMNHARYAQKLAASARKYRDRSTIIGESA